MEQKTLWPQYGEEAKKSMWNNIYRNREKIQPTPKHNTMKSDKNIMFKNWMVKLWSTIPIDAGTKQTYLQWEALHENALRKIYFENFKNTQERRDLITGI